ncbi:glycosyltransferase family 2 protein [Flavobacterium jejuense]|uniref:Glycosyltransferase family 2 protein n=1 Tax=Flavobacterium jejuense TaxID=1544455 RepID=A0ABX0IUF2_9FLAO|nr:glycosyltransferase family A protein [Flavobacterium jejuense]NHN27437.1 glycosyltransferase family 2 protein [Flavobacterium jejuense]
MKFSIITITHNRANLIGETIESVLSQTYKNFELLIIDDGSTDNTEEVVTRYIKNNIGQITYLKNERIGIPSKLRNIGLQQAKGDIITILDSDDLWTEDKLKEVFTVFSENKKIHFMIHNLVHFTDVMKPTKPFYEIKKDFHSFILKKIIVSEILAFPIFSFKKSLLEEIGFFDEAIMEGQHDYYLRVASKYKIFYLDKVLTLMRRHENNLTKNFDIIHSLDAIISYEKMREIDPKNTKLYLLGINFMNFKIAKYYLKDKQKNIALSHINKIINQNSVFNRWYLKSFFFKYKILCNLTST